MISRTVSLCILSVSTFAAVLCVPELNDRHTVLHPTFLAVLAAMAFYVRILHERDGGELRGERLLLCWFLALMPLVYIGSLWQYLFGDWVGLPAGPGPGALTLQSTGPAVLLEAGSLLLFGLLAWWGWKRSVAILAFGIALHAVQDFARMGSSAYSPDWYHLACAILDGGWALYAFYWLRQSPARQP